MESGRLKVDEGKKIEDRRLKMDGENGYTKTIWR
jgi:hypothetical protein